jgi:AcrR family transcriptional regulator
MDDPLPPYDPEPAPNPTDLLRPFDAHRLRERLHAALEGVLDRVFVAGCDDLDDTIAALKAERPDHPVVTATWEFLVARARRYVELGPDLYRRTDPWGLPPPDWTPRTLAAVHHGLLQLSRGRGRRRERPLQDLSPGDLCRAMAVLHHHAVRHTVSQAPDGRTLERWFSLHATTGHGVVLWALVTGMA